jgi:ParB family chromosome partitioning protein
LRRNQTIGNLALAGYDDIFNTSITPINGESIIEIPLTELHPPEFHPFNVTDDESMTRLTESIKRYGIREPGIARPRKDGGYELLSGNRRKRACELAQIPTMPIIIRELDDHSAVITIVDCNIERREKLLFSEKAWAYRAKMEALNHKGRKGDLHSVEVLVEQTGESKNQIFRLIRLTELVVALLDKVDVKQLAFNPAVELSYLSQAEQSMVAGAMSKYEVKPSLSQAQRLKKMKQAGNLSGDMIDRVLSEVKKPPKTDTTENSRYDHFFPPGYSPKQIDKVIVELLTEWKARIAV